jgi:MoaA/NifB/PqqE/SkfB family radical SAM enzyme
VISNGRLLRAKAPALADAGCTEVVVSLDGAGAVHDEIRGTPGLFAHCLRGIAAVCGTSMSYGINTVIQRAGADGLTDLAGILLERPKLPRWWHMIPVRDNEDLMLTGDQRRQLPQTIGAIRHRMAAHDVTVFADEGMFSGAGPAACGVPSFTAYFRADTGEFFGCNMLAYAGGLIGNIDRQPPEQVWDSPPAAALRQRCAGGVNEACRRCDGGSRAMNYELRELAAAHARASNG